MHDSLTSDHWYRVAGLHPRLRPHVSVRLHTTRGNAWYVLYNQATGRHHRVNVHAYELVGRLDGRHSIEDIWQVLLENLGDDAPSQGDVIRILGQMTDAGLIQAELLPDVQQLVRHEERRVRREKRASLNPFSFKLGLFNPSTWLEVLAPLGRALASPWVRGLWWCGVLGAAVAALAHAHELGAYGRDHFLTPAYLGLAWLAYPVMKALHEAAHALALRRHGCEVPEVGVQFFLFVPMPFVDASGSHRLENRWQRAEISLAGVWVEVGLAALATGVFLLVEEGWVRHLAFVVMSIGGLSSVLFNANPLMKFDGYHALCDVLELPNLASRSSRWLSQGTRRWFATVFGVKAPTDDSGLAGADAIERWALRLYAPAAWLWRLLVTGLMVVWAADQSVWLGWGVAAWALWGLGVSPALTWFQIVTSAPELTPLRGRVVTLTSLGAAALLVLAVVCPLPSSLVAEGVVWLPQDAQVRAGADGVVETVWVRSGSEVQVGEALVSLASPELTARRDVLLSQIEASQAEFNTAFGTDALRMKNAQDALARDQAALVRAEQELADLVLRAGGPGRFVVARQDDLEGLHLSRGQVLGHVLGQAPSVVRALVPQSRIDEVRQRLQRVEVMLDEAPGAVLPATWLREVPAASGRLPSPAMADRQGGRVATLPEPPASTQAQEGPRPIEPMFVIDVQLDRALPRAGGLARVRLALPPRSLGDVLGQRLGQLFLRHFSGVGSAT